MNMKSMKYALSILATLFFTAPVVTLADDAPPPLAEMWTLSPKADHGSELWKALGEHLAFRAEHGDPRAWQGYTPLLGDDLSRLGARYCCFNWADVDAYREWSDNNPQVGEHFRDNVAPHVEKTEHYFEKLDWGNSHWTTEHGPYKLFAVTEFKIKPGHAADFDIAREKMSQIALNQGWASDSHVWLWSSTIGGEANESIIIPHRNFASMDREEESFFQFLSRHMDSEDAARELMQKFSNASSDTYYQIWEHQEEISMSTEE